MNGTPVPENVVGYLMRNTQWLVQVIGVDGFRIDAAKNMQQFVMNYYDQSVYRASNRYLLNGQQEQIFAFSEVYDGSIPISIRSSTRRSIRTRPTSSAAIATCSIFPHSSPCRAICRAMDCKTIGRTC